MFIGLFDTNFKPPTIYKLEVYLFKKTEEVSNKTIYLFKHLIKSVMKNKIILIVAILLGAMMVNSGLNKFFHYMPMPEMSAPAATFMGALAAAGWFFPLVALVEIVGGLLLAIPKTQALGAIVLFPVVIGIVLFHLFLDPPTVVMSLIMLAILFIIIAQNRLKYMPMISK